MSNNTSHSNDIHRHTTITIDGINIDFPKDPYPCQVDYMKGVIRALNNGSNALLESPTGTGKTLCLLCATLAWQSKHKPRSTELMYEANNSDHTINMHPNMPKVAPYTIVYATRTHSQLAQIVQELRSTSYQPRMTVLGSREQLCIHEKVSKLKNGVINHACNSLNSKRACMYKNNLDGYMDSGASLDNTSSLDIEDMVKLGKMRKICPYFHSREFSSSADIVLLPYNYLLDSAIRKTVRIEWDKCIVIFDEAHNLERVAADAASFSLSSTDLALCIQEVQNVLRILVDTDTTSLSTRKQTFPSNDPHKTNHHDTANAGPTTDGSSTSSVQRPLKTIVMIILKAMFDLESKIDQLNVSPSSSISSSTSSTSSVGKGQDQELNGLVFPGSWLIQLLKAMGLRIEHVDELRKCSHMLLEQAQDAMSGLGSEGGVSSSSIPIVEPKLTAFAQALDRVFRSEMGRYVDDYKVYINTEEVKSNHPSNGNNTTWRNNSHNNTYNNGALNKSLPSAGKTKKIIHYWCFSTGVAMNELKKLGVKSILLTSGTLSPMPALREDLKLPFAVQLENPHVISDKQMWVAAVPVGVTGKQLNSTFNCRDTTAYKTELGETILRICISMYSKDHLFNSNNSSNNNSNNNSSNGSSYNSSSSSSNNKGRDSDVWGAYGVVSTTASRPSPPPCVKGGVLIFFPSYSVMDSAISHWKQTGIYDKLKNIVGSVISESRASAGGNSNSSGGGSSSNSNSQNVSSSSFMTTKARAVTSSSDDPQDHEFSSVVTEFNRAIETYGGCVLMAVCRGKVSEGIDFADNKGRAVIITGIPYAPFKDPWIVLKKKYLDEKCSTTAAIAKAKGQGQGQIHGQPIYPTSTPYPPPLSSSAITNTGGTNSTRITTTTTTTISSIGKENIWQTAATMALSIENKENIMSNNHYISNMDRTYPPKMPLTHQPNMPSSSSSIQSHLHLLPPQEMIKRTIEQQSSLSSSSTGHTLTGQGWYVQSAGRAVNQCIGRVIRHNKDWGTVFLLDDRFSSDAQLSQLSQWIRPRVKKYKGFHDAIIDFRLYLTAVVQDPTLNVKKALATVTLNNHQNNANRRDNNSNKNNGSSNMKDDDGFMFFKRQVVIKSDALDSTTDDNTFIDPSFLSTQQSIADIPTSTGHSNKSHNDTNINSNNSVHQTIGNRNTDEGITTASNANNLLDTMNQLRTKTSTMNDNNHSIHNRGSIHPTGSIDSFLLKQQQKQGKQPQSFGLHSSSSSSSSSHVSLKGDTTINNNTASSSSSSMHPFFQKFHSDSKLSQSNSSSSSLIQVYSSSNSYTQNEKMCDNNDTSSQVSFQLSQSSFQLSQSSSHNNNKYNHSQLSRNNNDRDNCKLDFNVQIGLLKPYYNINQLNELKLKLKVLRTVKTTSALRQCLDDLLKFMQAVDDVQLRYDALRSFVTLLIKDMRDDYMMMIEEHNNNSIDITISDDDDNDDDDDDDGDDLNLDEDDHDIDYDDDNCSVRYSRNSNCKGRSIVGMKRASSHNVEKHIQSIIHETKRKGGELEGSELLTSMMMIDNRGSSSSSSGGGMEGGSSNPRSVASKRAKLIFGSTLQSKSSSNNNNKINNTTTTIRPLTTNLSIKLEHSTNNTSSVSKSTNNITNNNTNNNNNCTIKKSSTDIAPTKSTVAKNIKTTTGNLLLDMDRLTSATLDPSSSSSSSSSQSKQANRFKCGVCTERPSLPCAGRCGHICCQACWMQWLKINATCPMCRAPADKNSVTRLIVKG